MSIVQKIRTFLSSSQGRKLTSQAQQQLSKPENQQKLRDLASRFKRR
ncbi:hypothetical protein [Polymorphospora rubra]|uniref:Uncharacterized protein n=1 Tax=Polymorphospora rubra TaxID=338584 RepID=A0A810N951_9ACTN|nr:hypothetical protein [Polymorphospora rubra]BCJ69777.1 hypothetical protein Prubr_67980 [Polymorphospora rubra]